MAAVSSLSCGCVTCAENSASPGERYGAFLVELGRQCSTVHRKGLDQPYLVLWRVRAKSKTASYVVYSSFRENPRVKHIFSSLETGLIGDDY